MFPRAVVFDLDGTWWSPDMYELWGGGGAPFKRVANTDSAMHDKGRNTVQLLDGTMRLVSELWHYSQNHSVPPASPKRNATNSTSTPFIVAAASTCDEPRWASELLKLFHTRPYPFDKPVIVGGSRGGTSSSAIHVEDPASYGGGGVVSFETVLGDFDEIYKANKRQHMANILEKFNKSKMQLSSNVHRQTESNKTSTDQHPIYIPALFAAALPEGTAVCPKTGLVTFTNPQTEEALRRQLYEEDEQPMSYKDFIFFDNQTNNIHDVSRAGITSVYVPEGMTMNNWAKGLQQWRKEQRPFKPGKV